jgi:hypothetical protein
MKVSLNTGERRLTFLDALGITGALGLLTARFIRVAYLPFWGCVWRQRTGWPCPGCGLTRAADRLAHFQWKGAFLANPLGALCGVLFGLCALYALSRVFFRTPEPRIELTDQEARRARQLFWVVLLLNWGFVALQTRLSLRG